MVLNQEKGGIWLNPNGVICSHQTEVTWANPMFELTRVVSLKVWSGLSQEMKNGYVGLKKWTAP